MGSCVDAGAVEATVTEDDGRVVANADAFDDAVMMTTTRSHVSGDDDDDLSVSDDNEVRMQRRERENGAAVCDESQQDVDSDESGIERSSSVRLRQSTCTIM